MPDPFDPRPIQSIQMIQVISIVVWRGAEGDEDNPLRPVYQYWSTDGRFLAEHDERAYAWVLDTPVPPGAEQKAGSGHE